MSDDLTSNGERVLTALAAASRPLTTKQLATHLKLNVGTVTRMGADLVRAGYAYRHDKRGNQYRWAITDDGRTMHSLIQEEAQAAQAALNGKGSPPPPEPIDGPIGRTEMEAAVWRWANEVTPRDLAEMSRSQLTRIWEATSP